MSKSILIAGAGIGGLAAALAMSRCGYEVTVLEAADTLGEVGAGIQLSPNAMYVLQALGIATEIMSVGFAPEFAAMRHWKSGQTLFSSPLNPECSARYGAPYIHIHRADAHSVLLEAAQSAGVTLSTGTRVVGYTDSDSAIHVETSKGVLKADFLIGADGIKSVVQHQMLGPQNPKFTGQVAWRAIVPAAALPTNVLAPGVTVWVGPDRHVVMYYLRGGSLANVVAVEERSDWTEESWTLEGDPKDLKRRFKEWHPQVDSVLDRIETTHVWALFDRQPLQRWSDGRAILLGDACHPTLPFMAQGACMAIEDAGVLAQCLSSHSDRTKALARYEALRKPRTSALQARARQNADLFHLRMSPITKAKLAIGRVLPPMMRLKALDSVYGYRFDQHK